MLRKLMCLLSFLVCPLAWATVTTQNFSVSYTCTGSTGPYTFTYPISDPTALTVTQNGTVLTPVSAYTVTPINNNYDNGGNVILLSACASGTLVIARNTPLTQSTVYSDNMPVPMKTFENSLDKLTEINQEIDAFVDTRAAPGTCPAGQFVVQTTTTGVVCAASGSASLYPGVTFIPAGQVLTTAYIASSCNGTTPALLLLPAGTVTAATSVSIPSNCTIGGTGAYTSIVSCSNATPIPSCMDLFGVTNIQLGGFTLQCAPSPATCTTALRIRYSTNVLHADMVISGGGYGTGTAPRAQVYTYDIDNVRTKNVRMINAGGVFGWVNGYNGLPSTRLFLDGITEENNLADISLAMFNAQFSKISNTFCNQNNTTDSTTQDGYCYLWYSTGSAGTSTQFTLSGCTGSGTLTCTVPLDGSGNTQLPVGQNFRVQTVGITGGTGTLNNTWDATLLSSTTFQVTGAGNTAGASFGSATVFYPTTHNTTDNVSGKNSAGAMYYAQGCQYCSLSHWNFENADQQETAGTLPAGCVAINAGYSLASVVYGNIIGPGTCNGSGQNGIDFANTSDLSSWGAISLNNLGATGLRDFSATQNANFNLGGIIVNGAQRCYSGTSTGTPHGGSVSMVCSNFTISGFFPNLSGVLFHDSVLNPATAIPCMDDFVSGINTYANVVCNGGQDLIAGVGTRIVGGGVYGTTAIHAVLFQGAQNISMDDFSIDGAVQGMFWSNSAGTQPSNITISHSHIRNLTTQPAFWDVAPTSLTITTHTTTSVDIAATTVGVFAGMGLGDYGTGGNNDIPAGTTISGGPYTCTSGCTVTISQAAVGSHASETGLLQTTLESGINIWGADVSNPSGAINTQGALFYGMQNLDIERLKISGFSTQGVVDVRGMTGQINPITINTLNAVGSSNVAILNIPGGILGSAAHVTLTNPNFSGTASNSIVDTGTGAGNVFDFLTGTLGGNAISNTNTADVFRGQYSFSWTPSAATVSTCTAQTKTSSGMYFASGQQLAVQPPADFGVHIWPGSIFASSANTLSYSFCSDATGATPPAGTWKLVAR